MIFSTIGLRRAFVVVTVVATSGVLVAGDFVVAVAAPKAVFGLVVSVSAKRTRRAERLHKIGSFHLHNGHSSFLLERRTGVTPFPSSIVQK